jgi:hypothetical protein
LLIKIVGFLFKGNGENPLGKTIMNLLENIEKTTNIGSVRGLSARKIHQQ